MQFLLHLSKSGGQRWANRGAGCENEIDGHRLAFDQIREKMQSGAILVQDRSIGNVQRPTIVLCVLARFIASGLSTRRWSFDPQFHAALRARAGRFRYDIRMHRAHVLLLLKSRVAACRSGYFCRQRSDQD